MKSPKTTALGVIGIVTALLGVTTHILSGTFAQVDFPTVIAAISAGVGLILAGDATPPAPKA